MTEYERRRRGREAKTKNWVVAGCDWLLRGWRVGGGGGGGAVCCGALWAGGSSCPAAVLLGSPSVWQAANHSTGKQCHFSSVCQSEQGREGGDRDVRKTRGGSKEKERQEAWKKQMGERGMRGGDGNGRRQQ